MKSPDPYKLWGEVVGGVGEVDTAGEAEGDGAGGGAFDEIPIHHGLFL